MDINYIESTDADQIYNIYLNHFSDMEYVDFYKKFHCVFKVTNDDLNNRIIAVGGIRPVAEAVVLTNKDYPTKIKMEALYKMFHGINYIAQKLEYEQIHAFAFDDEWISHLTKRMGFKLLKESKLLVLDVKRELKDGQEERRSTT